MLACDFFTVEMLFLKTVYALFFIKLATRRVHLAGCTAHPTAAWVTQQARQLAWDLQEAGTPPRCLVRDRAAKFPLRFDAVFAAEGTEIVRTPYRAPNANAVADRWVRSACAECLDHLLVVSEAHLRRVLTDYIAFYNRARPYQGLASSTCSGRSRAPPRSARRPEPPRTRRMPLPHGTKVGPWLVDPDFVAAYHRATTTGEAAGCELADPTGIASLAGRACLAAPGLVITFHDITEYWQTIATAASVSPARRSGASQARRYPRMPGGTGNRRSWRPQPRPAAGFVRVESLRPVIAIVPLVSAIGTFRHRSTRDGVRFRCG